MDVVLIKQQNLAFKKQLVLLVVFVFTRNMTGIISGYKLFSFFYFELFPVICFIFLFPLLRKRKLKKILQGLIFYFRFSIKEF
jgi:hypothetical protein